MKRGIVRLAGLLLVAGTTASVAQAQQFTQAGASFRAHVTTACGALRDGRSGATEGDLFRRCNGALSQPTSGISGLTPQADVLDQYFGVQDVASQSDAAVLSNRSNSAIAGRLSAVAGQMSGSQSAGLMPTKPILLASLDQDSIGAAPSGRASKLDGFISLGGFKGEQDSTNLELGFEQDGYWAAIGLDYQFSDTLVAGAAATYLDTSGDFDAIGGNPSGGSMDSDGWSLAAYGVYMPTPKLAVTGLVSAGSTDFSNVRNIDLVDRNGDPTLGGNQNNPAAVSRRAMGETSGDMVQATVRGSYNLLEGATSITPHLEISYYDADIDGFTETGADGLNLRLDGQKVESLQIAAGATFTHAISTSWGVLLPYARAQATFETKDDAQSVLARYAAAERLTPASSFVITTNPADDFSGDVALGVSSEFAIGFTAFAEYGTVVGLEDVSYHSLAIGLRKTF